MHYDLIVNYTVHYTYTAARVGTLSLTSLRRQGICSNRLACTYLVASLSTWCRVSLISQGQALCTSFYRSTLRALRSSTFQVDCRFHSFHVFSASFHTASLSRWRVAPFRCYCPTSLGKRTHRFPYRHSRDSWELEVPVYLGKFPHHAVLTAQRTAYASQRLPQ